jgi:phosphoribosylanthranilate isomerase
MYETFKTKIKVNGVTHLTDARYFAAAGVHYMGFDLFGEHVVPAVELQKIAAIKEWVSGPKLFITVNEATEDTLEEAFAQGIEVIETKTRKGYFGIDGFEWFVQVDCWKKDIPVYHHQIVKFQNLEKCESEDVWVSDVPFDQMEHLIKRPIRGIQFDGSAQERVGVKSFEDYDRLFEFLV